MSIFGPQAAAVERKSYDFVLSQAPADQEDLTLLRQRARHAHRTRQVEELGMAVSAKSTSMMHTPLPRLTLPTIQSVVPSSLSSASPKSLK